jgi:thioredoxin 1
MDGRRRGANMAGSTVEITKENFQQTVEKDGIVLLDWWAAWCGPCRSFAPTFEKAAKAHPDITFGKIDTEAQPELAGSFQIRSIPTLMILRDKVLLFSQPGALPEAGLEDLIKQVRALDMDKVRAEIAAQQAGPEEQAG